MSLERIRAYYERNPLMVSSPFGGVDGLNAGLLSEVLGQLRIDCRGLSILDVGCGRGYVGDYVRERGGRYTGMDVVASRAGVPMAIGDAAAAPFPDGSFDAVFCIDAFEHFPEPVRCAAGFGRVLRPGGFVFLSAPNYGNMAGVVKWWCEHAGSYERNSWAPFGKWQAQEYESALTAGGVRRIFGEAGFGRFERVAHGGEVLLGVLPWAAHPGCPEGVLFRLQRLFGVIGQPLARVFPGLSLHNFWKIGF